MRVRLDPEAGTNCGGSRIQSKGEQKVMDIPLVDLKRQYKDLHAETHAALDSVLDSMRLFLGPNVAAFEREYADYVGSANCIGVSDGTMALYLALRACDVGPGDEVITVSHTFFATVEAITLAGATPVFVDIDPATFTMDVSAAAEAITPRTRVILPVHLYGRLANMPALMALARRHGLRVIEDACQAHGARLNGQAAGTFGDIGCFSFYYSKNLGAYGEAGGIVTDDTTLAGTIRMLRDHGSNRRYQHDILGLNSRLDEMQAAILRIKLPLLDAWNEERRRHAARYGAQMSTLPIDLPETPGQEHVFHLYVIRTGERDALREHLESRGIHTGIHYPIPCHLQPACRSFAGAPGSLPVTESTVNEILSLPMFPELRDDEIHYVVSSIREYFALRQSRSFANVAE